MADAQLTWGQDLTVSATGDIALSDGTQAGQERVLRRLLTNSKASTGTFGDYLWHQDYGGGLPAMVGQPANPAVIEGIVRQQMAMEVAVSQSPPPTVTISSPNNGYVYLTIQYVDAVTGDAAVLSVPVPQ